MRSGIPFAISGAPGLYDRINTNGKLDIHTSENTDGDLTEHYIEDRSMFLYHLMNPEATLSGGSDIVFADKGLGIIITADNGTPSADDRRYYWGSDNGDDIFDSNYNSGDGIFAGDDHIYGMGGNDKIYGHGGNDYIEGGKGSDTMYGGSGDDIFHVEGDDPASDLFDGGDGYDTIEGGVGDDVIRVTSLDASNSIENIDGKGGANVLSGSSGGNIIDLSGISVSGIDRIEGSGGADTITGTSGNDIIYGGSRDAVEDFASDILKGGSGDDEYHVGIGDIVADSDNTGTIFSGDRKLSGLIFTRSGQSDVYINDDSMEYARLDQYTGTLMFFSSGSPSFFSIENFSSGNYGITLEEEEENPEPVIDFGYTVTGDFKPATRPVWYESEHRYIDTPEYDEFSNPVPGEASPGMKDWLYLGDDNTHIRGMDGNDILGGSLQDLSSYISVNDLVEGGNGSDILMGWEGNDLVYGGDYIPLDQAIERGESQEASSAKGEFITEGPGNGILVGEATDDAMLAGTGSDIMVGGGGDDILLGDAEATGFGNIHDETPSWEFVKEIGRNGDNITYNLLYSNIRSVFTPEEDNGDDIIYGGAGDDWIFSGGGKDFLEGGTGNDILLGQKDDDVLLGGEGEDVVHGGAGADILFGGDGNDTMHGEEFQDPEDTHGNDLIDGGRGDDVIRGYGGKDIIFGGEGDDLMGGGKGDDILSGGQGLDEIYGDSGSDMISGNEGNDRIWADSPDDITSPEGGNDIVDGGDGDDQILGQGGNDTLFGGADRDHLDGGAGDDYLSGDEGDDGLFGGDGNDILVGGAGLDFMNGGEGDDTYIFNPGDSPVVNGTSDAVEDTGGSNTIVFGSGVDASGFAVYESGAGMVTAFGENDYVYMDASINNSPISYIKIENGQTLKWQRFINNYYMTEVSASTASAGSVMTGGGVADTLQATGGGGTFAGGRGNDSLSGAGGNNTYLYDNGDGIDTIADTGGQTDGSGNPMNNRMKFGEGIYPENLKLSPGSITITDGDGAISGGIILAGFNALDVYGQKTIDIFEFEDGTVLEWEELVETGFEIDGRQIGETMTGTDAPDRIYGNGGNDIINAGAGDDFLDGGQDNDILNGGAGSDTYFFKRGYGHDSIVNSDPDPDSIDVLMLGEAVFPADLVMKRSGDDLYVEINDTEDHVFISGYFTTSPVDTIIFSDGFSWNAEDIASRLVVELTEGNDTFSGTPGNDIAYGLAGDDVISGTDGNDRLDGGTGNDTLTGGAGNDTFVFGAGYGQDIIDSADPSVDAVDRICLLPGIAGDSLVLLRIGDNLVVRVKNSTDQITVNSHFTTAPVDFIDFADGISWSASDMASRIVTGLTEGNDSYTGTSGNDVIEGLGGSDYLYGLAGNDSIDGGTGNDRIYGEAGNDVLWGRAGSDLIDGGDGDDRLYGDYGDERDTQWPYEGCGDDDLYGGAGNDFLDGGARDDKLNGGPGSDIYYLNKDYRPVISQTDSAPDKKDAIQFAPGLNPENCIVGRSGNNLIIRSLDSGGTTIASATVKDFFVNDADNPGSRIEEIRFADGTVWDIDAIKAKSLIASGINDSLTGYASDDILDNGCYMYGKGGNNTYLIGQTGDHFVYEDNGIESVSKVRFKSGILPENISVTTVNGDLVLVIKDSSGSKTGTVTVDGFFGKNGNSDTVDLVEFENGTEWTYEDLKEKLPEPNKVLSVYFGTGEDETVTSTGNLLRICGMAGNDIIYGNSHDDRIEGGEGNDQLYGGSGNDILLGYGINQKRDYSASQYDTITENIDNPGNDLLVGGKGNDSLYGGFGEDTYLFGNGDGHDFIGVWKWFGPARPDGAGITTNAVDTVRLGSGIMPADIDLYEDGENLIVTYNDGHDAITVEKYFVYTETSKPVDKIEFDNGQGPVWTETEILANLVMDGSQNSFTGTPGDDTFTVDNYKDTITDTGGIDTVNSSVSYTLTSSIENLTLTGRLDLNAYGNGYSNVIRGNSGNNMIYGYALSFTTESDTAYGGAGDDTYIGIETIIEMPDEGIDTVIVKNSILNYYTLPANVENLFFGHKISYFFNEELTGNELDNIIASSGYNGSDDMPDPYYYRCYIDGGTGADIMIATGNDYGIFTVDNPGDRVFGHGEIKSYVDYTVPYGFYLTLIGSSPVNGFGSDGNNGMDASQNPAVNILTGGKGNDSYILGAGDRAVELPDEGYDKVKISGSGNWYLSDLANIEEIEMLEAAGNAGIIGDSLDNNLKGNKSNNYLDGGAGADIMAGGMGNDIYIIDNPGDVIIEEDGWHDEVRTSISLIMPDSIEIMTLIGSADINAQGNENGGREICGNEGVNLIQGGLCSAYRLYGNGGNDTLNGGELNDLLNGGNGNDILNGGSGNDSYYFNPGFGQDIINIGNLAPEVSNRDIIYLEYGFESSSVTLSKSGENDIILKISGTNDQILIKDALMNSECVLEKIEISDDETCTEWDSNAIMERLTYINGTAGNDILSGDSSGNKIFGLSGDDSISGLDGSDILYGDAGNDSIYGGTDSDYLYGGTGNDSLSGDSGNDTYYFSPGFGNDTITSTGNLASDRDMIFFESDLCAGNMRFIKNGNDLQIKIEDTSDIITAKNHFLNNAATSEAIREIRYYDGTSFDINSITLQTSATYGTNSGNTINGTSAQNVIKGFGGTDKIYGKGGNDLVFGGDGGDTLYGDAGNDIVSGDAGNDKLYGGTDNDILNGGTGNDTLYGEAGNDTYIFGSGIDTVSDSGGTDILKFDLTISRDSLAVFRTASGYLVWDVDNGTNQIKIVKQTTSANTVEKFVTSDGYWLSSSDVSTVIQDMTAYASSNGISFESYEDSRDMALMGILYSAWHAPV